MKRKKKEKFELYVKNYSVHLTDSYGNMSEPVLRNSEFIGYLVKYRKNQFENLLESYLCHKDGEDVVKRHKLFKLVKEALW